MTQNLNFEMHNLLTEASNPLHMNAKNRLSGGTAYAYHCLKARDKKQLFKKVFYLRFQSS